MSDFSVLKITPQEWASISENCHAVVFQEKRPFDMDRLDYVLLAESAEKKPCGYCTVRELDSESVYWQYGGGFPGTKESVNAVQAYGKFIEWTKSRYKRISTYVENSNVRYLKLAMHFGFRVVGCRFIQGKIYLDLLNEFSEETK